MTPRADVLTRVEAVNLGLTQFAEALQSQGAPVVQVDWRPPGGGRAAGGDAAMLAVLTRLWGRHGTSVAAANRHAVSVIEGCAPRAVTVARAGAVVPGLSDGMLLHSGPPITWDRVCDPQRRALLA